MRVALISLLVVAAAVLAGGASGTRTDPYRALLGGAYPDISLPVAYSSADLSSASLPAGARSHGATGAINFDLAGPDPTDGIVFVIFKTPAAAAGDLGAAVPAMQGLALHAAGKVAGVASSELFRGTYTSLDALNDPTTQGVTYAVAPQGDVLVGGFTFTASSAGGVGGASALLKSGRAHVHKLTGQ
jgi:hypothetical protein